RLHVPAHLSDAQQAYQMATQYALLACRAPIDAVIQAAGFADAETRALAWPGLAHYFAGALVLPYGRFLAAAESLHYDIELLAQRFGVSFETVCHRLSTLQRPEARGVPFFFVRVDRAGNISKRQSATDFHFSHSGGTCPLWNVYEAFAQPHKVLTQIARMPDGRTYLWIARCVTRATGGFGSAERTFAIGLGCDVRHAARLVYAKGLHLSDPGIATPIGAGCKVCDRQGCPQRAFPALGKRLRIDENEQPREPYASR
ncbi:MAG: short-chain fatty acyl-CoA regulator family protein, partial [Burkholderiaceae bacterium]